VYWYSLPIGPVWLHSFSTEHTYAPGSPQRAWIEADLAAYLPTVLDRDDAEATRRCEHLIRTYDRCISCATHFLRIENEDRVTPAWK
jgi:Ni,Fe-hydrogenase I large subunit